MENERNQLKSADEMNCIYCDPNGICAIAKTRGAACNFPMATEEDCPRVVSLDNPNRQVEEQIKIYIENGSTPNRPADLCQMPWVQEFDDNLGF